jgi:creatinine amidohydrolase/Fe(II)-dependent formamide hydrolase-like protein
MEMPARGEVVGADSWRRRFPEGPCGVDPSQVSAEKGGLLLEHLSRELAEILQESV